MSINKVVNRTTLGKQSHKEYKVNKYHKQYTEDKKGRGSYYKDVSSLSYTVSPKFLEQNSSIEYPVQDLSRNLFSTILDSSPDSLKDPFSLTFQSLVRNDYSEGRELGTAVTIIDVDLKWNSISLLQNFPFPTRDVLSLSRVLDFCLSFRYSFTQGFSYVKASDPTGNSSSQLGTLRTKYSFYPESPYLSI